MAGPWLVEHDGNIRQQLRAVPPPVWRNPITSTSLSQPGAGLLHQQGTALITSLLIRIILWRNDGKVHLCFYISAPAAELELLRTQMFPGTCWNSTFGGKYFKENVKNTVTVTAVTSGCQCTKVAFWRRLSAAPSSPHLLFLGPDVPLLLPLHFFSLLTNFTAGNQRFTDKIVDKKNPGRHLDRSHS